MEEKKFHQGDVREDGWVFRTYMTRPDGSKKECWLSPQAYEKLCERKKLAGTKYAQANRLRVKAWAEKNPDKVLDRKRKWNKTEGAKIARHKWNQANHAQKMELTRHRQAAKRNATPKWLTSDDRWIVEEAYKLAKIREKIFGFKWHVDHIVPLRGETVCGLHVPSNLQVIPASKNMQKGNRFNHG